MTTSTTTIYHVGAACDAHGIDLRPATLVIHQGRLLQIGRPEQIRHTDYPGAIIKHQPDVLVLPRMVNAHAHLDMAAVGPRPYEGSFPAWLASVVRDCPNAEQAPASVEAGWRDSLAAGVGVIGDIARYESSAQALAAAGAGFRAVSFVELFGQGQRQQQAIENMRALAQRLQILQEETGLRLGLEPHAPYSVGLDVYQQAATLSHHFNLRLTTHLAESRDEDEFIRHARGPMADLLRRLGKWDDTITPNHQSPVQRLAPALDAAPWLVAHCNYMDDDDIATLAKLNVSVAYCPIASAYFGHENHRYRDMLKAGVNVCLGTDSILCQPADEAQPHGIWPQMRFLYERDRTPPMQLLAMATVHGAKALGVDPALVTLQPESPAQLMMARFDPLMPAHPLEQALRRHQSLLPLA
jgi:cytosine/adenosine deaminase-related metal-dependent hydrolase